MGKFSRKRVVLVEEERTVPITIIDDEGERLHNVGDERENHYYIKDFSLARMGSFKRPKNSC